MKVHTLIVDDFLPEFDRVRALADVADYQPYISPVDGVEYPFISSAPDFISELVYGGITKIMGLPINIRHVFFRASPDGVHVPNQVHNDSSMGEYSLMVYMNRREDCIGGTSFLRHKEMGFDRNTVCDEELEAALRDRNNPDKWVVTMTCPMETNRAIIFSAELMHRAEPVGGFGSGSGARVVLTAFFDLA